MHSVEDIKKLSEQKVNSNFLNAEILRLKKEGKLLTKSISDGYHTIGDLYEHRRKLTLLFALLKPKYASKSWKHHDEINDPMFDNSFIVVFDTPEGQYSYHYNSEFWDEFKIPEIPNAPEYDGHKPEDIDRLFSLLNKDKYLLIQSFEREISEFYFDTFENALKYVYREDIGVLKAIKNEELLNEYKKNIDLSSNSLSFCDSQDIISFEFDKDKETFIAWSNLGNMNNDYKLIKLN